MRESIREFVHIVAKTVPIDEPIYEFGALQIPGFGDIANLRPFFPGRDYIGCDMREGPGVDKILNLHHIDVPDNTAGTVIMLDTLEHVEYPHRALEEVHRILKPDGIVILSTVLDFRIHDAPSDYWRYTPDGIRSLLKPFRHSFVGSAGRESFPHTLVGIGFKSNPATLGNFESEYHQWREKWLKPKGVSWKDTAYLFIPPILLGIDRRIARLFRSR